MCFSWHQLQKSVIVNARDFCSWTELQLETRQSSVLLTAHFECRKRIKGPLIIFSAKSKTFFPPGMSLPGFFLVGKARQGYCWSLDWWF